jgi:hypothetical protein
MSLLRLVAEGDYAASQLEMWLRARLREDGTREWAQADGGYAERSRPTLDVLLNQYASMLLPERPTSTSPSYSVPGTTCAISPFLCSQMSAQIQCPWPAIWAAVKVRVFPPTYGNPYGTVDMEDHRIIRERFMAMPVEPHVLIDEGDRFVGLWRLAEPFEDREDPIPATGYNAMAVIARQQSPIAPSRGARLLFRLAHALRGDLDMAKTDSATLLLPGQKIDLRMGDSPSVIVTASCFDPEARTSIEDLEAMVEEMAAQMRG